MTSSGRRQGRSAAEGRSVSRPPELSIVTATTGRRHALLMRKLDTLLQQTLEPERFEWIVCGNGGGEETLRELEASGAPFAIRTVLLDRDRGPGHGRNAAAALARGRVIYLSDDDCLLNPQTLALHLQAQSRPCVVVGAIEFDPEPGSGGAREVEPRMWRPRRVGYWNLNGANTSLPTASFRTVGGFDERLEGYGGEDVLLGYELSRRGLPFLALPAAAIRHVGPDPASGADLGKAASAGANAARIAALHPELTLRLGVHPLLLGLKLTLMPALAPLFGSRFQGDLAYARGARGARRAHEPTTRSAGEEEAR